MSDSPLHNFLQRCDNTLVFVNRWALIVLLAVMSALVIVNVFARYVFSHSFPWVEEATRYMMIWAAFLGAGPALRVGGTSPSRPWASRCRPRPPAPCAL